MKTTEVVQAFIEATAFVFASMAQITITPCRPFIKKDHNNICELTGLVTAQTDSGHRGSIALTMSRDAAEDVAKIMLGDCIEDLDEDAKSTVGEFTNILSGDVRRRLGEKGVIYHGKTPTMIYGLDKEILHETVVTVPVVVIPFVLPVGKCAVEFALESIG